MAARLDAPIVSVPLRPRWRPRRRKRFLNRSRSLSGFPCGVRPCVGVARNTLLKGWLISLSVIRLSSRPYPSIVSLACEMALSCALMNSDIAGAGWRIESRLPSVDSCNTIAANESISSHDKVPARDPSPSSWQGPAVS